MLVQERDVASFGEIPAPATKAHSALLAAEKPYYQVGAMASYLVPGLSSQATRKHMAEKLEVIDNVLNDPRQGYTQRAFNIVSELGSSILPTLPLSGIGGIAARGVAGAAGVGLRAIAPEAITTLARKPLAEMAATPLARFLPQELTAAKAGIGLAESYGVYKGFTIPEHVVANYHKENDVLDYRGAIKDWSSDNYGFLLAGLPFVAGYIGYKGVGNVIRKRRANIENAKVTEELGRLLREHEKTHSENMANIEIQKEFVAKTSELQEHLGQAVEEGHLSPEEHDWYQDYLFNPDDHENLNARAMDIMRKAGIPYDRVTGHIWFPMMERADIKNLKQAISDEVATNFSDAEQQALSKYIVHNRMDAMRSLLAENPNMVHGLRGYTHFIDAKLGVKEKAFAELDKIITKHLPQGLGKKELFSQNNIYKHLKKNGVHDVSQIPYTVPEGVAHKLKLARKIDLILSKKGARYEQWYKEGLHTKLKEELKAVKLLTPAEELAHLREMLMPEGKLVSDFKNKKAYHRLEELSQLWSNAKDLLSRVHMEQEYEKQRAFNEVLKKFVDVVDSNAARFADPSRVTRYLQKRVESAVPFARQFKPLAVFTEREITEHIEEGALADNLRVVTESRFEGLKQIVQDATSKINQIKEQDQALAELINCALGE
jgi:hypothetical protein